MFVTSKGECVELRRKKIKSGIVEANSEAERGQARRKGMRERERGE